MSAANKPKIIALAAAQAGGFGIGYKGHLPWKCPADMAYFKKTTQGGIVLMGRVTADGFPKPLPKRENLVWTGSDTYRTGFHAVKTFDQALDFARERQAAQLFVIGGAKVYEVLAPEVDELHLTLITPRGMLYSVDTYFPNYAYANHFQRQRSELLTDPDDQENDKAELIVFARPT